MGKWFKRNMRSVIFGSFLVPILLVAFVSISHVTLFYELSNPLTWAVYLSVAVEIAALGALAAVSVRMGNFVYVPFSIVTLIQLAGNIFFSYSFIDEGSQYFRDWVELMAPLLDMAGIDADDIPTHKRFLAVMSGGLLPLISLTFIHMLVKYSQQGKVVEETTVKPVVKVEEEVDIDELSRKAGKMESEIEEEKYTPTEEDLERLEEFLKRFESKEEVEEQEEWDEIHAHDMVLNDMVNQVEEEEVKKPEEKTPPFQPTKKVNDRPYKKLRYSKGGNTDEDNKGDFGVQVTPV